MDCIKVKIESLGSDSLGNKSFLAILTCLDTNRKEFTCSRVISFNEGEWQDKETIEKTFLKYGQYAY